MTEPISAVTGSTSSSGQAASSPSLEPPVSTYSSTASTGFTPTVPSKNPPGPPSMSTGSDDLLPPMPPSVPVEKKGPSKMPLVILVLVLLAGVGAFVWRYLAMKNSASKATSVKKETTQETAVSVPTVLLIPTVATDVMKEPTVNQIKLEVSSPKTGATVTSETITVSGTTEPGAEVAVNDEQTKALEDGTFSVKLTLDEGENDLLVFVNDSEGNYSQQELSVTYEAPLQ